MKSENKKTKTALSVGVVAALASSLCCIAPVLAIFGGIGGFDSAFAWMDPLRPYLIGFTASAFGFAWYQKLKPAKLDDCDCEIVEKSSFLQSKSFLGIMTVVSALLLSFPYYSQVFYPAQASGNIEVVAANISTVSFSVDGMSCNGCESSVTYAITEQAGIIEANSSYKKGSALVKFDKTIITAEQIAAAIIDFTGYEVTDYQFIN